MVRAPSLLTLLFAAALGGPTADAQVLHERVELSAVRCNNGVCWRANRAQEGAAAIVSDGEVLPAPVGGPQPEGGEPIYSPASDKSGPPVAGASPSSQPIRRDGVRMDRETGPEPPGKRHYHEPFNPAVFPFKRMSALDGVQPDETLVLARGHDALTAVPVVGADKREPGRDAFWGSIVVDFEPGRWVPIPSPAADARLLAYRTEPPSAVDFARDGADNYFARAAAGGRRRLIWLVDAPQSYFAGDLPLSRIADEPRALVPAVPAPVVARAQKVWARIGVVPARSALLNPVLDALVEYFRGFETGDAAPPTTSLYLDLALARHGSCRHRSYAFVVTALAAGIPARYVENELHVFVEVYVPRVGWRRINLGGALVEQDVEGAEGKTPYKPKGADPFPEPAAYAKGGDAVPPTPPALKRAQKGRGANGDGKGNGAGGDGKGGSGASGGLGDGIAGDDRVNLDALDDEAASSPAGAATHIRLAVGAHDAFRGDRVDVSGVVESGDGSAGGLPVELYLDGPGGALRVGSAVTAADGSWHAAIELPRDLPVGDHRVVARMPGDAQHRASSTHLKH
jgi:hypothetical protein